ncbi:MAG TPA: FAD-dependent oxidoreductase, partial [Rectinemataceae bacterium]|nr:FAD-dependent oxidoreductase [Rectinemataceae bacterium]
NIMIGPSAEYLPEGQEREDYSTTQDVMAKLSEEGVGLLPELDVRDCIRSFSGIRPKLASEAQGGYADFIIEESSQVPGFIQLVGIESPGLTSSIPIAKMVAHMTEEIVARSGVSGGTAGAKKDVGNESGAASCGKSGGFQGEPGDQKMLCRCEGITEEAVLSTYDRILKIGAIPTVKGLKNRSRVTMGNCQGSFCTVNIIELLQKKRNVDPLTLLWNGFGSEMFEGRVKE